MRRFGWLLALWAGMGGARAETYNVAPATLADVLKSARAGDTLLLAPGQYVAPLVGLKDRQTLAALAPGVVLTAQATDAAALDLGGTTGLTVRGFRVVGGQRGIDASRSLQAHLDYCVIDGSSTGIAAGRGSEIRRCTVLRPSVAGIASATGADEIVVAECRLEGLRKFGGADYGLNLTRTRNTAVRGNTVTGFSVGIRLANDSRDTVLEANRLSQSPILIEDSRAVTLHANTVEGAAVAIELRHASDCRLQRNWLLDRRFFAAKPATPGSVGLLLSETDAGLTDHNVISENLFQVCGEAVQVASPALPARPEAPWPILARQQWTANRYDRPDADPTTALVVLNGARRLTLATLATYDRRGAVAPSSVADLGLEAQWAALPVDDHGKVVARPLALLADPTLETGSVVRGQPLEWRGDSGACQLVQDADAHSGQAVLEVDSERTPAGWLAWRGAAIPVSAGQRVGAALWLELNGVTPAAADAGVLAQVVFTSSTGQKVGSQALVGPGETPLLRRGSQPWNDVSAEAIVPDSAAWATLEVGLDRAAGSVRFDDLWLQLVDPAPPVFERKAWPIPVTTVAAGGAKPKGHPWRPPFARSEPW